MHAHSSLLLHFRDDLVKAADMTSMDLGSLLSDLVAAKKRMREKKGIRYGTVLVLPDNSVI